MADEVEVEEVHYHLYYSFLAIMGKCRGCENWFVLDTNHRIPDHERTAICKEEEGGTAINPPLTKTWVCHGTGLLASELKYADT